MSGSTNGIAVKVWERHSCGPRRRRLGNAAARRWSSWTHSFQAPGFYEHLGYERKYTIEDRPKGHSNIVYVKLLQGENGA